MPRTSTKLCKNANEMLQMIKHQAAAQSQIRVLSPYTAFNEPRDHRHENHMSSTVSTASTVLH